MRRQQALRWALSIVFILSCGARCDSAGCDILEPMPNGNEVPMSQTIEGGMQLRITPTGFQKISAIIPGMLENMTDITVIDESVNSWGGTLGSVTFTACPGGCNVDVDIPPGGVVVSSNSSMILVDITLNLEFVLDANLSVEVFGATIVDVTCGLQIDTWQQPLHITLGIEPYIRQSDGELRLRLVNVSGISLAGIHFSVSGCGLLGDYLQVVLDFINNIFSWLDAILGNPITEFIVNQFLLPMMQDFIDGLLPDPLGLEGQFDIGSLLSGFSPGAEGKLELRLTPGGYVNLYGNGLSLGVITGVNSDSDPTTRSTFMDPTTGVREHSEPHRKMPPMPTPDFTGVLDPAPPDRQESFKIDPSSEMGGFNDSQYLRYKAQTLPNGDPNPNYDQVADLGIGVGETFLNLVGFHLLNSGALCLEIGTAEVSMLTAGLFSIMVDGLTEMLDPLVGDAPMRMVIRPQTPLVFDVRNNLDENNPQPLLKLFMEDFQIDMYVWSEERYTKAFTMAVDMELGLDLMQDFDTEGNLLIVPVLDDVDPTTMVVRIHDSEIISNSPEELEMSFPNILSMLMPMITGMLPEIAMPELMGIQMSALEFRSNDAQDMMLILASLATPSPAPLPSPQPPVVTDAQLLEVTVPTVAQWRASQRDPTVARADKEMPTVRIAVTPERADPRDVEWQYRLNSGAWRPFRPGPELVIKDPTFTFQGWHHVEVRGRVMGRPETIERQPQAFDVLIDSMAPLQRATVEDGQVFFNGLDFVTPRADLVYAYQLEEGLWSEWSDIGSMPLAQARQLAAANGGVLRVRVMDESGNVGEAEVGPQVLGNVDVIAQKSGCGCASSESTTPWAVLAFGLFALLFFRRRRPAQRPVTATVKGLIALSLVGLLAATGCAKKAGNGDEPDAGPPSCTDDDECSALQCEDGQIPLCIDGTCQCVNDLPWGKIGQYSSLAVSYSDIMVAAYNARYGDLMFGRLAVNDLGSNPKLLEDDWEFIDGVPWSQEPDVPTSDIRGGIRTKGENVGRFTAIGAGANGQPVIAYYDVTHGALKLARFDGANWVIMVVDDGGDSESADGGDAGRYAAISMRNGDRAPGISYMVRNLPSSTGTGTKSEIRFAQAIGAEPSFGSDWNIYILDEVEVPEPDPEAPLEDYPAGIGVTSGVTRTSDDRPVVVYYDSINGNLKGAEFDTGAGDFLPAVMLDGDDGAGNDTGNVGMYPSVKVHTNDTTWHISYMDVALKQLLYLRTNDSTMEVVDDGLRESTNPITGFPMPVSDFVGWDSKITVVGSNPEPAENKVFIAYQDSSTHEILYAERDNQATRPWSITSLIGGEPSTWNQSLQRFEDANGNPWEGSFGFYLSMTDDMNTAYLSCFAINEWSESDMFGNPPINYWVQIFAVSLSEG